MKFLRWIAYNIMIRSYLRKPVMLIVLIPISLFFLITYTYKFLKEHISFYTHDIMYTFKHESKEFFEVWNLESSTYEIRPFGYGKDPVPVNYFRMLNEYKFRQMMKLR